MTAPGILSSEITQQTANEIKAAFAQAGQVQAPDDLRKALTTANTLYGYSLEAPAKKLVPVLAPLRNRIPRHKSPIGAPGVNWRQITDINSAKLWGGATFGVRNQAQSYTTANKVQNFKTLGIDGNVQDEAVWMGRSFEDVRALDTLACLQNLMMLEERVILGGNTGAIAKPASVTAASATGGSLTAATTYDFGVSALTAQGVFQVATGRVGGVDAPGETDTRNGSFATAAGTGTALNLSWPAVRGAFGYNVYAGTSAGTKFFIATVYATSYQLKALVGSGNVINVADQTGQGNDFDGILTQIEASSANAYWSDLAGLGLTADNAGGITEFDTLLKYLWDTYRTGPTLLLLNSQEAQNITKKITNAGSTGLQYKVELSPGQRDIAGGIYVSGYLNKFASSLTPGIPNIVPFMIHPYMPPGKAVFLSEVVPYPNSEIQAVFEMEVLQEYADFEWARVQRQYEHGVYCSEALKVYAPFTCGIINGIGNL